MAITFVDSNGKLVNLNNTPTFNMIDNYIYVYHTSTLIILPTFPETITDQVNTTYGSTNIMGRSAPIYSYSNSGPRSIDVSLKLHRDMMNEINTSSYSATNMNLGMAMFQTDANIQKKLQRKDYIDLMIKELQAIAFPNYQTAEKMVNPPLVAVRFGDEVFCKGIVEGGVQVSYSGPIIANPLYNSNGEPEYEKVIINGREERRRKVGKGKYALADISFRVHEVDPYSADIVAQTGSFRGIDRTLERNLYKVSI
ncbi:MAG: hypothetical protein J6R47_04580 [Acholeplasmatales bacterium]|nr:hypothetical protein [Acholeplasmatales bacterium]